MQYQCMRKGIELDYKFTDNIRILKKDSNRHSRLRTRGHKENKFIHKKSLGQNFLHDEIILDKIIQSIPYNVCNDLESRMQLIEVGIGLGDLTKRLLDKYKLLAYEIDDDLIEKAKQTFKQELVSKRLVLVQQDVLKVDSNGGYLFDGEYFLVSNLPYYIATAVILKVLKDSNCKGFVVMTQKEVAQKFCATSKDSSFCALSVLAQSFGDIQYLFEVSKESFTPQPKVQSAVFCFQRKESFYTKELENLLHYAFISPRKKLFTNLMQYDMIYGREMLLDIFKQLNLSKDIRAHEVGLQEYCQILQYMKLYKG